MLEETPDAQPSVEELPTFIGLDASRISIIHSAEQAEKILPLLLACDALGFDTESQPTFVRGQKSTGPHLIQLATEEHAYLFPLHGSTPPLPQLIEILQAPQVLKVGFGLRNDIRAMHHKYEWELGPLLDLSRALRENKKKGEVGAKTAVARFFQQNMRKPKNISTSNWGRARLTAPQILYAANDAYVALMVYRKWRALGGRA